MNKKLVTMFGLTILPVLPVVVLAINIPPTPSTTYSYPLEIVTTIINGVFRILWPIFGAVAVGMLIFAGFQFLTAHGEPAKISSAKNALIWGVVGVAVALLSSTIPYIVTTYLGL